MGKTSVTHWKVEVDLEVLADFKYWTEKYHGTRRGKLSLEATNALRERAEFLKEQLENEKNKEELGGERE